MTRSLTPAAARAAAEAGCWKGAADPSDPDNGAVAVLLALALQPECRAAEMLAAVGIDADEIQRHWPQLSRGFSAPSALQTGLPAVRTVLRAAELQFDEFSQPASLATEHLLLGVAAARGPAAEWLALRGLPLQRVVAEVERMHGVDRSPISWEDESDEALPATATTVAAPARDAMAPLAAANADDAAWRLLDAAANRAREALRVVEDLARFAHNDTATTAALKTLRHELAEVLERFPLPRLLAARDVGSDVGTTISTPRESARADLQDIATANFKRLQESLRSLEEVSKLHDAEAARRFEQLRYQAYGLESRWAVASDARQLLAAARLYVLIDGRDSLAAFERLAGELAEAGVDVLQLRDKRLTDRELLERASGLRRVTRGSRTLAIVNDRPDLALLSEADGVHVGQEELSVADARRIVGPSALVGLSTHSLEQAREAAAAGADYVGVGPVFASTTKRFDALPGLDLVRAVCAETVLPAFAIGGITRENLDQALGAGATRVAVRAAVIEAADAAAAARELRGRLPA